MQKKEDNDIINDNVNDIDEEITEQEEEMTEEEEVAPLIEDYEDYSLQEEAEEYEEPYEEPEEEYEPEPEPVKQTPRKRKKKKKKKRRSRLPGIIILTTFIFAVSVCLSLVIIAFGRDMLGIGKSETTKLIVIPDGATTIQISELLKDEGIIKSPKCFQMFSRLRKSDSNYIAGEHFVRPNMAYETIINELTTIPEETKETVEVTFPEGCTLWEGAYILEENGVCSAEDFIFYFNSGGLGFEFENRLPSDTSLKLYRMEGYMFPDTYFFYENMEPEQVCQKIYLNFNNKMTPERYAKMESLGLSLDELVTFASIVQKEAANTDTMLYVASVFWNRLRNADIFPLLQSDPTSNYSQFVKKRLDVYDRTIVDSYDTYVSPGLPPGAICNPGIEAIDAVLENVESNYFYFIANIYTGQTYFSETLDEHEMYQEMVEGQVDEYIIASREAEREAEANAET